MFLHGSCKSNTLFSSVSDFSSMENTFYRSHPMQNSKKRKKNSQKLHTIFGDICHDFNCLCIRAIWAIMCSWLCVCVCYRKKTLSRVKRKKWEQRIRDREKGEKEREEKKRTEENFGKMGVGIKHTTHPTQKL